MQNMSYGEAKRRAQEYGATVKWITSTGEYRVTLDEWSRREAERKEYFTTDAEDAYLTAASMRRKNPRNTAL